MATDDTSIVLASGPRRSTKSTVESRFLEPSISRTSRCLEPNLVSLGFATLKFYNFTPDFSNPRFLETPDNSNQFWLPWDKLTLDNSNLAKTSKPLSSFSFSPRRRFVFQTEISGKYIVLVLVSRLFYFLSWGSVYRFLYRIQNARG